MNEKKHAIVTINDLNHYLSVPCDTVKSKEDGEEIAKLLFRTLTDNGQAAGLAAPQIGIRKRVCIVNIKEPLYFINPKITPDESEGKFVFLETCLSIPGRVSRTERWRSITIEADNIEGADSYDISNIPTDKIMESVDAYELACIQHEVDHIFGILMTDRKYLPLPFHTGTLLGRNEKCACGSGKKYKKCCSMKVNLSVEVK